MRPRRKYVSRHEAGHAVAALVAYRALGWPASLLREATVIESGENRGAVSWVHTYSPQSPALADLYAMNAEVIRLLVPQCKWAIIVALAGVEADAKLSRVSGAFAFIRGGESDYVFAKMAADNLARLTGKPASLELFEFAAKSLVRIEATAIRAVADALHHRGTMTGPEIDAVAAPALSGIVHKVAEP